MLTNYLKRYPISLFLTLAVVALSVLPIGAPEVARDVPLADKWVHMVMYFVLSVAVGWELRRGHSRLPLWQLLLCGFCLPALLGGALELVQNYCTTYRSGEWLDFAADSIGAAVGFVIMLLWR